MDNNFIVNIGRQLGSGGREIGEKLATRLGIDSIGVFQCALKDIRSTLAEVSELPYTFIPGRKNTHSSKRNPNRDISSTQFT